MSLRIPTLRATQHLLTRPQSPKCLFLPPKSQTQLLTRTLIRTLTNKSPRIKPSSEEPIEIDPNGPIDPIALHRLIEERRAYYKRRSYFAGIGLVCGMIAIWVTTSFIPLDPPNKDGSTPSKPSGIHQMDSGRRSDDPLVVLGRERKIVIQKLGEEPEERVDVVPTGTSSVPTFPRVLEFYDDEREKVEGDLNIGPGVGDDRLVEYQLLGLGIRTVSFLGIEVYVVGMYVATDDIAALQQALIREIEKGASTLVAGEREELERRLYDPEEGSRIWSEVLRESGCRTLIRITPTRNTDFHHLRDAWVRSLTNRAMREREYGDERFGQSVKELGLLLRRGNIPKGKELLLSRDRKGMLAIWYDDGKVGAQRLGAIEDERVSRAIWLNYLGGKTVASEGARESIIKGVMEFVERPVGTVATQVL